LIICVFRVLSFRVFACELIISHPADSDMAEKNRKVEIFSLKRTQRFLKRSQNEFVFAISVQFLCSFEAKIHFYRKTCFQPQKNTKISQKISKEFFCVLL